MEKVNTWWLEPEKGFFVEWEEPVYTPDGDLKEIQKCEVHCRDWTTARAMESMLMDRDIKFMTSQKSIKSDK
jgi:hypothetical protein